MSLKLLSLRKVHYYYIKYILVVGCNKNWSHETLPRNKCCTKSSLYNPINFTVAFTNLSLAFFASDQSKYSYGKGRGSMYDKAVERPMSVHSHKRRIVTETTHTFVGNMKGRVFRL